jgi:hypothetical protein
MALRFYQLTTTTTMMMTITTVLTYLAVINL